MRWECVHPSVTPLNYGNLAELKALAKAMRPNSRVWVLLLLVD